MNWVPIRTRYLARRRRASFTHKLVTPTAAGVDFLKQRCDQYPWAPGTAQDIAKNGCGKLFMSIEACPVEYDLTAIADRTLRLGERPQPSTLHAGDQADQASGAWLRQGIGAPRRFSGGRDETASRVRPPPFFLTRHAIADFLV